MPRKYERKTETKYKIEDVEKAMEDVKNKKITLSKASGIYSVPKSTLHDYIKKQGIEKKCGRNAVFTNEQEKALEEHIIKFGKHFDVITKDIVRKVAFKFAHVNKLKHNFDLISQTAGKDWFYGFRKRHPNIDFQRSRFTANSVHEADIKMFFNNWEALLYIGANDGKAGGSDVQKQFISRPPRRRYTETTTRADSESSSSGTAIGMEDGADVFQDQQQTQQQSLRKKRIKKSPYSNAERQKRYREKRKADKMNARITSSQSSDDQSQQEQPQYYSINERQPLYAIKVQSNRKRIHRRQNLDPAELARKRHLNKLRQSRFRARQRFEWSSTSSHQAQAERYQYTPKRLAVLCERVLKKYKLLPAKHTPQIEPSDFSVVGGKPLRKRKEPIPEEPEENEEKTNPDGRPIKKRGRPKSQKQVNMEADETSQSASETSDTNFEEHIKMEELDIPPDDDPFGEETTDLLVDIKEEFSEEYNEDNEEDNHIEAGPSVTETNILMPTLVPTLIPGQLSTSKENAGALPVIPVILDDIQIFANSVAEQLRAMPVNRALLLQLDIQNMLENEKQIMKHES